MAEPGDDAMSGEKRQRVDEESVQQAAHAVQRLRLEAILQYVGAGAWYYVALLDKRWCNLYRPICEGDAKRRFTRPVCATFTSLSNVLASPSRLMWASSLGLPLAQKRVSLRAGVCASRATIRAGEARGLQLNAAMCEGAASQGRLR